MRKAPDLFAYLNSDLYGNDTQEGRGICLYGDAALRSDLLALIAKGHAAAGRSTMFLTVHALLYFIEHDQEKRTELAKVKNLFIDGFERMFTKEYDCPYTFYQQVEIEEFLTGRRNSGLINNFNTHHAWSSVRWWSRDFIAANAEVVREIKL